MDKRILSFFLMVALALSGVYANSTLNNPFTNMHSDINNEKVMTIDVLINNNSKVQMVDVPTTGYLEVFSILGVKVMTINLRNVTGVFPIDLPKGVYILKAGKVAQKIIAR